jgi:hypothetical protein
VEVHPRSLQPARGDDEASLNLGSLSIHSGARKRGDPGCARVANGTNGPLSPHTIPVIYNGSTIAAVDYVSPRVSTGAGGIGHSKRLIVINLAVM